MPNLLSLDRGPFYIPLKKCWFINSNSVGTNRSTGTAYSSGTSGVHLRF